MKEITCSFLILIVGSWNFALLVVVFDIISNGTIKWSENTREEIEIEPFQNEELMDDIHVIETSIENLSLEIKASRACESNDERFILNLQKLHVQRLF